MKKAECEIVIRRLVHQWAAQTGVVVGQRDMPSFIEFKDWAVSSGYSSYFDFRSFGGADRAAEMWFDHELKQEWRN